MNETTGWTWTEITRNEDNYYISSSDCIRIDGENLITADNKFNFSFSGNSTSDEIKDPNNGGYWLSKSNTEAGYEFEFVGDEKDGITLTPPYVNYFRYISDK